MSTSEHLHMYSCPTPPYRSLALSSAQRSGEITVIPCSCFFSGFYLSQSSSIVSCLLSFSKSSCSCRRMKKPSVIMGEIKQAHVPRVSVIPPPTLQSPSFSKVCVTQHFLWPLSILFVHTRGLLTFLAAFTWPGSSWLTVLQQHADNLLQMSGDME